MAQEYYYLPERNQSETQQSPLNRRSRFETYCDILRAVGAGAEKPTRIMYKANLSWTVMHTYIKTLEMQNLLVEVDDDGKRLYHMTQKGFETLSRFISLRDGLHLDLE